MLQLFAVVAHLGCVLQQYCVLLLLLLSAPAPPCHVSSGALACPAAAGSECEVHPVHPAAHEPEAQRAAAAAAATQYQMYSTEPSAVVVGVKCVQLTLHGTDLTKTATVALACTELVVHVHGCLHSRNDC